MDPLKFSDDRAKEILDIHRKFPRHKCASCRRAYGNPDYFLEPIAIPVTITPNNPCETYKAFKKLKHPMCFTEQKFDCEVAERNDGTWPVKWAVLKNGSALFGTDTWATGEQEVFKCYGYRPLSESDKYHIYLQSDEWRKKRRDAIEKAGYRCQICGSGTNLQVHHITYDRLGDEHEDDLIIVCKHCHDQIHSGNIYEIKRRYK